MFKNYLKIAWRNLIKNKLYSIINITGLSVGVACSMLIFLYVSNELSYDEFHKDAEQIYRTTRAGKIGDNELNLKLSDQLKSGTLSLTLAVDHKYFSTKKIVVK